MTRWIRMLMMVAMVMTTLMPAVSHASMNSQHTQQAAHNHADCDHHADQASHDKHASKDKTCCEKGVCKCIDGHCHGGLTSILGKDRNMLAAFDTHPAPFAFADPYIASVTLACLKRPPKASPLVCLTSKRFGAWYPLFMQ